MIQHELELQTVYLIKYKTCSSRQLIQNSCLSLYTPVWNDMRPTNNGLNAMRDQDLWLIGRNAFIPKWANFLLSVWIFWTMDNIFQNYYCYYYIIIIIIIIIITFIFIIIVIIAMIVITIVIMMMEIISKLFFWVAQNRLMQLKLYQI